MNVHGGAYLQERLEKISLAIYPKKDRYFVISNDQINIHDSETGHRIYSIIDIRQTVSTCSTLYFGLVDNITAVFNLELSNLVLNHILTWAFGNEFKRLGGGYTEIICTTLPSHIYTVNMLESSGFKSLGNPFINLRTNNTLQHYHLFKEEFKHEV